MWPAALCPCCHAFVTVMYCSFRLWAKKALPWAALVTCLVTTVSKMTNVITVPRNWEIKPNKIKDQWSIPMQWNQAVVLWRSMRHCPSWSVKKRLFIGSNPPLICTLNFGTYWKYFFSHLKKQVLSLNFQIGMAWPTVSQCSKSPNAASSEQLSFNKLVQFTEALGWQNPVRQITAWFVLCWVHRVCQECPSFLLALG